MTRRSYALSSAAVVFIFSSSICSVAQANAFVPTMMSANILWVLALPLVVVVEGWFMAKQNWSAPYKNAIWGNLISMLAALPVGIVLSGLGSFVASENAKQSLSFISTSARFTLAQILLYGQLPSPAYGFTKDSDSGIAGIVLAAIVFMGICWIVSIGVEGFYYGRKNPHVPKSTVYRITAVAHLVSYALLLALWIPYSYNAARSDEEWSKRLCTIPNAWGEKCPDIFTQFPRIKQDRLENCKKRQISEDRCLSGPSSY